jgi:hypothetical protein
MFYIEWIEQFWQDFWSREGGHIERLRRADVDSLANDPKAFAGLALRNLRGDIESVPAIGMWMYRFGDRYPDLRSIWARQLVDEQKALDAMEPLLKKLGYNVHEYKTNPVFKEGWELLCATEDLADIVAFGITFEREHYLHHVNLGKAAMRNGNLELALPYMELLAPDEYRHCTMVWSYIVSKYFSAPVDRERLETKLRQFAEFLIRDAEDYGRQLATS